MYFVFDVCFDLWTIKTILENKRNGIMIDRQMELIFSLDIWGVCVFRFIIVPPRS